jgi:hypothetical protein
MKKLIFLNEEGLKKMKKWSILLAAVMMFAATIVPGARAQIEFSGDAYASINSMYLWRGFDLSPDADYVVQPGMDISFGGFTLRYWSNLDSDSGEMNETDLTVDYSFDANDLISLSLGNIFYALEDLDDTNELYLGVGFNTFLSPSLKVYYDYDEAEETGLFYTASIGHSFDLKKSLGLSLGALVSYNQKSDYAVGDYSDLHNAEISLSLDYAVNDRITVSPAFIYSAALSDDAEDIAGIDEEFMGGVTVALTF